MSKLLPLGIVLSLFLSTGVFAQDQDPEAVKKSILEKVREKLAKERAKILKTVAEIIEKELKTKKKKAPAAKKSDVSPEMEKAIKKLEREERILKEQFIS